MKNQNRIINTLPGNDFCPADNLMNDFRKVISETTGKKYPKHIAISVNTIEYWKKHADEVIESEDIITFMWDEIVEEQLPPLKIKVKNNLSKYSIIYLKEYGTDKLLITCKSRKGKNKNGTIYLEKETERGRHL
ncbi:MAG: hypothetical protein HFI87_03025 [Bacilli bacterium]|nr:hypothetical protein [Bacilli bacterium]